MNIAFIQALKCLIHVFHIDLFNFSHNIVLRTEIKHLLGFGDPTDIGTGKAPIAHDDAKGTYFQWLRGQSYQHHSSIMPQNIQILVYIVFC